MSLKAHFGHEENLSRHIAFSAQFKHLLSTIGAAPSAAPELEKKVKLGHDECAGRLDIFQPTTKGDIIVEVQYGRANNAHADRLQNYATNFHSVAAVIFIAERFSNEMLLRFRAAKTPVYCVQASLDNATLVLRPLTAASHVTQSQAKRIAADTKKAQELMTKLFAPNKEYGVIPADGLAYHSDPEANVSNILDYYLGSYPKKTRHFLQTSPAFAQYKEDIKDELAFHCWIGWQVDFNNAKQVEKERNEKDIAYAQRLLDEGFVDVAMDTLWPPVAVEFFKERGITVPVSKMDYEPCKPRWAA